jgi:zinc transport system substrate-binding protein
MSRKSADKRTGNQIIVNKLNIYKLYILISIISGALLFDSCKPSQAENRNTLSVTIEPQKYFLRAIAGNHYDVDCLIPSGIDPESSDFTPARMAMLDKSVAYFETGRLSIENIMIEKALQRNSQLKIVDCSAGIDFLEDTHESDNELYHYGHAGKDPHIWSSVKSAKIMAENIRKALVEMDTANETDYNANYDKLIAEINNTDSIIKSYLIQAPSKAFIIYHPALSYFANEYGLTQYTIEHEGKNPSPAQLKELIDKTKAEGVRTVFVQQEFDAKNAETVAEAIGGKIIRINLLSYNWSEEMIKIAKTLARQDE